MARTKGAKNYTARELRLMAKHLLEKAKLKEKLGKIAKEMMKKKRRSLRS